MSTHFFADTSVLLGRSMRHIFRSVDTIITTAITPIALMLLFVYVYVFVYVFGGAISTGTDNYVNYLLPGIMLIAIASGIAYTAVRLFTDMQSGIFERFQSMPIARSSVLWAHVLTSLVANGLSLVIIVLVALLMGFRTSASLLAWLAVAGILTLFTLALTWLAIIAGLSAKSVDGAGGFSYPLTLPAVHQLCVRPDGDHAGSGSLVRREPAGHLDRQHHPGSVRVSPGWQRYLDRTRMVRRHPRSRLRVRHGRLPAKNHLRAYRTSSPPPASQWGNVTYDLCSRWPTIPFGGPSGSTCHERTDSCLGFCIRWSEPEEVAGCTQFDECGSGDGAGIVLSMGESDTGIMA